MTSAFFLLLAMGLGFIGRASASAELDTVGLNFFRGPVGAASAGFLLLEEVRPIAGGGADGPGPFGGGPPGAGPMIVWNDGPGGGADGLFLAYGVACATCLLLIPRPLPTATLAPDGGGGGGGGGLAPVVWFIG